MVEVRAVSMPVDLTLLLGGVAIAAILLVVILYYFKFRRE
jgi:hypothetical protein